MRQLTLQVHPLSRRVLLCEYGAEPLIFPNHDFYFKLLTTGHRVRSDRREKMLSSSIDIMVDDGLARHIESKQSAVGTAILRFHFHALCQYADAALQLQGKGHVKAAIESWLLLHGIDETEYSAETAYKLWQRKSWDLEKKNPRFFVRSRGKSALKVGKKIKKCAIRPEPLNPLSLSLPELQIEMAAKKFVSLLSSCFLHPPKKIEQHARIYYYLMYSGDSSRNVAARLGLPKASVLYAKSAILRRASQNPTFSKMLQEAMPCALPEAE